MKNHVKILLFFCCFSYFGFGQTMPTEGIPTATISDNLICTLDADAPLSDYYKIDISHLSFESEEEALLKFKKHLTGNLITNEVHLDENFVIIQIHHAYLGDSPSIERIQNYLTNALPKV